MDTPEPVQRDREPQGHLCVAVRLAPVQRRREICLLALQAVDEHVLAQRLNLWLRLLGQLQVVLGVSAPDGGSLGARLEALEREFAHRFEHAVPGVALVILFHLEQIPGHQRLERVARLHVQCG
jgi:hypothetical protein